MSSEMYDKEVTWQHDSPQQGSPQESVRQPAVSPIILLVIGLVVLLAGGMFFGLRGTSQEPPSPSDQLVVVGVPTPTTPPPTATLVDPCGAVVRQHLKTIADLESQLKWDAASEHAEIAVRDPEVCENDRAAFARIYRNDSLEGLYARPFDPSRVSQEEMISRYQQIKRTVQSYAQLYDVELPNPLSVAQRSSQSGAFLLALHAADTAFEEDRARTRDISLLREYISNLYNVGWYWSQHPSDPNYQDALAYLSASRKLATYWRTGQGEAETRLKELLGPDERRWPEPKKTPLLSGE